jgi:hypothetical protein
MRTLLAVSLIVLGVSFSVSGQEHSRPPRVPPSSTPAPSNTVADNSGWTKFTNEEGRFSVLMPGVPTTKSDTVQSEHGPYTTHLFILRGETVFLIGYVDYDPNFNFNKQSELAMNRDNFVKGLNARLVTTRPLTLNGYQAIEFIAETPQRIFKSRVYMVGRRPYQIVIGSPKGVDDTANMNRFFNSFQVSLN